MVTLVKSAVVALVLLTSIAADARIVGAWRHVGDLSSRHEDYTATVLQDGRILIASRNAVELFDPAAGTSLRAEGLDRPGTHSAVLLTDGRVLIASLPPRGSFYDPSQPELIDPVTLARVATGPAVRYGPRPALVATPEGGVVVIGGRCIGYVTYYHPAANFATVTMPGTLSPTIDLKPVKTASGSIVIAGGGRCNLVDLSSVWIESSGDGGQTFSTIGRLHESRMSHSATHLGDERLLVAGGINKDLDPNLGRRGTTASAEIVDAATGVARQVGSLLVPRFHHAAVRLAGGGVLIASGFDASERPIDSVELFDPATETFRSGPSVPGGAGRIELVRTNDDRVFAVTSTAVYEFVTMRGRRRAVGR